MRQLHKMVKHIQTIRRPKQLNYHANPTSTDEQPNMVVVHVGSNNINKFNYSKYDVEDHTHIIIDTGKNVSHMVSTILQYR